MNKRFFLLLSVIGAFHVVYAQDSISIKNGEIGVGNLLEVGLNGEEQEIETSHIGLTNSNTISLFVADSNENDFENYFINDNNSLSIEPGFKPFWCLYSFIHYSQWNNSENMGDGFTSSSDTPVELGGAQWFTENSFLRIGLGFRHNKYHYNEFKSEKVYGKYKTRSYSYDKEFYSIYLPFDIGYSLAKGGSTFNLLFGAGAFVDLAISGEAKSESNIYGDKTKISTKLKDWDNFDALGLGLRGNIQIVLGGFTINAMASFGIAGHEKKYNYYCLGIGMCI